MRETFGDRRFSVHISPRKNTRTAIVRAICAAYSVQMLLILIAYGNYEFNDDVYYLSIVFVGFNFIASYLFTKFLLRIDCNWPIHTLLYSTYYVLYILKATLQYAIGLNSFYTMKTIQTYIDDSVFIETLNMITLGHVVLIIVLGVSGKVFSAKTRIIHPCQYPSKKILEYMMLGMLLWVVVTSIVMYKFGVAVMGTESVELPYRLSGVMYYSRGIVLPMLLLYVVQKSLDYADVHLFKKSIGLLILLALSEIVVRASKAPMFILVLQLVFLYVILLAHGKNIGIKIRMKYVLLGFVFGLMLWPVVEVYRTAVTGAGISAELAADVADFVEAKDKSYAVYVVERLFQRLLGYLQFAGLVSNSASGESIWEILSYNSISGYYTQVYLGLNAVGHKSSPSMLGTALLLGSETFWIVFFAIYLVVVIILWNIVFRYKRFCAVIASMFGVEVFNTMMAGTIDSSLDRIGILFAVAMLLEIYFSSLSRKK